jgi:hypothetical protein
MMCDSRTPIQPNLDSSFLARVLKKNDGYKKKVE